MVVNKNKVNASNDFDISLAVKVENDGRSDTVFGQPGGEKRNIKEIVLKTGIHRYMFMAFGIICLVICGAIRYLCSNSAVDLFEGFAGVMAVICLAVTSGRFCKIFEKYSKYSMALYLLNGYWLVLSRTAICRILSVDNAMFIILFNVLIDFYLSVICIRFIFSRFKTVRLILGIE